MMKGETDPRPLPLLPRRDTRTMERSRERGGGGRATGVRGKKQSSPSAPAVFLLCCLPFLAFSSREGNRECSKSYHTNLSHIIKLFKVFLKFKTSYSVFVEIKWVGEHSKIAKKLKYWGFAF